MRLCFARRPPQLAVVAASLPGLRPGTGYGSAPRFMQCSGFPHITPRATCGRRRSINKTSAFYPSPSARAPLTSSVAIVLNLAPATPPAWLSVDALPYFGLEKVASFCNRLHLQPTAPLRQVPRTPGPTLGSGKLRATLASCVRVDCLPLPPAFRLPVRTQHRSATPAGSSPLGSSRDLGPWKGSLPSIPAAPKYQ